MHITLFSFVTAVLLSSLLIVVLYLSRKSVKTIRMLNFGYLACLYLFCLGRMFFSVELPFTIVVNAPTFMNPVSKFYRNTTLIAGSHFSKYELLLLLWAIGAIFLLTRFFLRYIGEKRRIDRLSKFIHTLWNRIIQTANSFTKPGIYGRRTVSYPAP